MKIRTDYVTNSSSSSFILGFTNEDNIKYELVDGFNSWEMEYFGEVFNDVQEAQRLTKEEVIHRFYDELTWDASFIAARRKGIDLWRNWDWKYTDEAKELIKEEIDKMISDRQYMFDKFSVFVEVEYSDHDCSELEHEVMPHHKSCIVRFNHH